MAVLSIRKYLTGYGTESTNPLLTVCTLLLEGIIRSALPYDREEYSEFRATLEGLTSVIEHSQDGDQLVAAGEQVCEALGSYNRGVQRMQAAQTVELRCMIEMLGKALAGLAEAGGQSVQALQNIRAQVENARQLDDIRVLRARLGDSLKAISEEAKLQRERNAKTLHKAEEAAMAAASHPPNLEIDRVSGLPNGRKAEKEISTHLSSDSRFFAAVFVVERLESINLRYGYSTGDHLLEAFSRHLLSNLTPKDQIYRWRGPSFLVLLERSSAVPIVRAEVGRFASGRQEHTLEIDGRPIKLPITCAWSVIPLAGCEMASQACQQIDRFVAEHWEKRG